MAIRVSEVKSSRLSDDKKEVIVAGTGKYTGDLELRFARECLDQLLQLLTQAKAELEPSVKSGPVSDVPLPPAAVSNASSDVAPATNPDEVRFEIPKNFTVTADTTGRGLVLFILNHRLENQRGYALSPDAAKQVAGGLVKSAEASLAIKQSATPTN
jgi:hypothetical protein